eukprot:TRINITY_DN30126_c0_g1_i1.p1 TRINITY_DN30126_c0_g1~~TRINITY_DN30126_c0_g1_i1.p1  ORF type:complete len:613 (+),score=119.05 TRINITY_DN30126_c0_g1_i1:62-1900(+)
MPQQIPAPPLPRRQSWRLKGSQNATRLLTVLVAAFFAVLLQQLSDSSVLSQRTLAFTAAASRSGQLGRRQRFLRTTLLASSGSELVKDGKDGKDGMIPEDAPEELGEFLEAERTENMSVRVLGRQVEIADIAAAEAIAQAEQSSAVRAAEVALIAARDKRRQEVSSARVIPSGPVFDIVSLANKYGGARQIYSDHKAAARAGYFSQLQALKEYLNKTLEHNKTALKSFIEFERDGSRLVLVGTNHLSRDSREFAREVVRKVKPKCLLLQTRMGDDSMQRLTVPEALYQNLTMWRSPVDLMTSDTQADRARKFQSDRLWLEVSPGWNDIGPAASAEQEFGAAFEEFCRQRMEEGKNPGGPRGGTVIFGDSDLRPIHNETDEDKGTIPPSLNDYFSGGSCVVRELQIAQSLRAAMKTHKTVVGVVEKGLLAGISRLLNQDPLVQVKKAGMRIGEPEWIENLEDEGEQWQREFMSTGYLFGRLAQNIDYAPVGTWIDAEAAIELQTIKNKTATMIIEDGLDTEPLSPPSSDLVADFVKRGIAVTPRSEQDLIRWLNGESVRGQEPRPFQYENRIRRQIPVKVPGTGFPQVEMDDEEEVEDEKEQGVFAQDSTVSV